MNFRTECETTFTGEPYYDLVQGYINPSELLKPADAKKVKDALAVLEQFFSEAFAREYLVET
ncbi:hypothetical protein KAR91_65510 [Candidatus Pacearchaeota archaeon]|nr:hypothetical protein [Candidatus Pacearchaeota archaeon]